jgi:hypothetical protein
VDDKEFVKKVDDMLRNGARTVDIAKKTEMTAGSLYQRLYKLGYRIDAGPKRLVESISGRPLIESNSFLQEREDRP